MFTVLFVEDNVELLQSAKRLFEDNGIVMVEARYLRNLPPITDDSFDVVIWDGDLIDGMSFDAIRMAKKTFTKPMIAASGSPKWRRQQMEAGCNLAMSKYEAFEEVIRMKKSQ